MHEALVFQAFATQPTTWLTAAEIVNQLRDKMSSRSCRHQIKKLADAGVLVRRWVAPEFFHQLNKHPSDSASARIEEITESLKILHTRENTK